MRTEAAGSTPQTAHQARMQRHEPDIAASSSCAQGGDVPVQQQGRAVRGQCKPWQLHQGHMRKHMCQHTPHAARVYWQLCIAALMADPVDFVVSVPATPALVSAPQAVPCPSLHVPAVPPYIDIILDIILDSARLVLSACNLEQPVPPVMSTTCQT